MNGGQIEGLLLKAVGGLYTAETESGVFECKARGIFRKQNISPCVGDRVILTDIDGCTAVVDKILPRKNSIIRSNNKRTCKQNSSSNNCNS